MISCAKYFVKLPLTAAAAIDETVPNGSDWLMGLLFTTFHLLAINRAYAHCALSFWPRARESSLAFKCTLPLIPAPMRAVNVLIDTLTITITIMITKEMMLKAMIMEIKILGYNFS